MLTVPKCISRSYFEKNQELYPAHAIANFPWAPETGAYKPESYVRVAHSGSALFVRLWCKEADPRAVVTEWNGPVWTDSALEFFIEPVPGKGYFNFEMNSVPALLAKGILCNICVCLAVWCGIRLKNEAARLIMVLWCILIFMICSFEHSVANMSIIAVGLLNPCGQDITVAGYFRNLLFVSLGNMIGGGAFVALPYYLISKERNPVRS